MISRKVFFIYLFIFIALVVFLLIHQKINYDSNVDCNNHQDRNARMLCWQQKIELLAKKKGVKPSIALLNDLHKVDLLFSSDCHVYAHIIGELSFWEFQKHQDFQVSEDTTLCAYGFYHGFMMEAGHHDSKFLEKATETCLLLTSKFSGTKEEDTHNQCFHGIGHGLVFFYVDKYPKDEVSVTQEGISYCEKIISPGDRRKDCIYGIYGGIASLYFGTHGYLWPMSEDNPFWLCYKQPDEYQGGCINALIPAILSYWEEDVDRAVNVVEEIDNILFAREAVFNIGIGLSHKVVIKVKTNEEIIRLCQSLRRDLGKFCINGLASGIFLYSLPGPQERDTVDLCESELLTPSEQIACFQGLKEKLKFESPDRLPLICQVVSNTNKRYCDEAQ